MDTDDGGDSEFEFPEREYKFRADWEGRQHWNDVIDIISHQVNVIDMDLDLLGFNLTGRRLYAHNESKNVLSVLVGFPYSFLASSLIAAPGISESIFYYHDDHLGRPQVLTGDQGQVVWKPDYKPFGGADIVVETVGNNLRFPGQYYDQETGLYYNYHWYYHWEIGRYLRPDPIGLEGRTNPFVYADGNPACFIDIYGLLCTPSQPMKTCLEYILRESVDKVRIYDHSWYPKLHFAYVTTRRNKIYINGSCEVFWDLHLTVLEEYYHVLKQWNTGRLSIPKYLRELAIRGYERNKYEVEAKEFARRHLEELRLCLEEEFECLLE